MPLVAAKCTQCGAAVEVDSAKDAAICKACSMPFIVEKAINHFHTYHIHEGKTADKLADNAETFIKLQKHVDAMNLFLKMQADYPADYRGWWGATRIRSNEFTAVSLGHGEYDAILNDGKNAISVSEVDIAKELHSKLDGYVSQVYQTRIVNLKEEFQNKKTAAENDLRAARTTQANAQSMYLDAERAYRETERSNSSTKHRLSAMEKVAGIIRGMIFIGVAILTVYIMADARSFFSGLLALIGVPLIIGAPAVFIWRLITSALTASTKKKVSSMNVMEESRKQTYTAIDKEYRALCARIEELEKNIQEYSSILTETSKERDTALKEECLRGKHLFYNM